MKSYWDEKRRRLGEESGSGAASIPVDPSPAPDATVPPSAAFLPEASSSEMPSMLTPVKGKDGKTYLVEAGFLAQLQD